MNRSEWQRFFDNHAIYFYEGALGLLGAKDDPYFRNRTIRDYCDRTKTFSGSGLNKFL